MDLFNIAEPGGSANARRNADEVEDTAGLSCEMKTYATKDWGTGGTQTTLEGGFQKTAYKPKEKDHDSAFVLTKYYFRDRKVASHTQLEVRSPHVRAALRAVIKKYPGVTFDKAKIIMRNETRCLFHYRNELREYGLRLDDHVAVEHLVFILNYMYKSLESEISSYYNFMESQSVAPGIDSKHLWMAFRPGDLIYTKMDSVDKIVRLKSTRDGGGYGLMLHVEDIQYNGTAYGRCPMNLYINDYRGYKPLEELQSCPLQYMQRKDAITASLITRGRKFLGLRGVHHRYYEGLAETLSPFPVVPSYAEEEYSYPRQSLMTKSRVMIDSTKFSEMRPQYKKHITPEAAIKTGPGEQPELSEEDLLICSHTISGFSLASKRWCFFLVDAIQDFEYNTRAFELLLLAPPQKKMIHSLIKIYKDDRLDCDDIIKGKGKGMIFLFHGEPGVGKTLTAQGVADYTQRPLYTVTTGDLGVDSSKIEGVLLEALQLAAHWNAIVLIDEADVFLEQRSSHDLTRNGLVAVFLRVLEYYEGMMILTTNRISTFDAAFKSRIHLAIKYPALSFASRRDLWVMFVTNVHTRPLPPWWDDEFLNSVAAEALNGRQIKNAVRTAYALAIADGSELRPEDIRMSVKSIKDFEEDFAQDSTEAGRDVDVAGHGVAAPDHRSKRQRQE